MNATEAVNQISTDFSEKREPFDDVAFPEERLLEELTHSSLEERANFASIFATFDYNRDAGQLVDNLIGLYHSPSRFLFTPASAAGVDEDRVAEELEEFGFRYPNRDAHAWVTNGQILKEKYNGRWSNLYLSVQADAPSLVERLNEDDFLCVKGAKIAPMYARIVNDSVTPLTNVWDLEIPVDTHIRRLSKDLFSGKGWSGDDLTDDRIREEWRGLAIEEDIDRHVVDGGLWHIGNKWDDWGEDYWNSLP